MSSLRRTERLVSHVWRRLKPYTYACEQVSSMRHTERLVLRVW